MRTTRAGFTMIEIMIYIVLVTAAMVVMAKFAADVTVNAARSKVVKEVELNAQLTMQRLSREVRNAQVILSPTAGSSSELVLRASDGAQVTLRWNTTSNAVERQEGMGTPQNLSTLDVRVTALNFTATGEGVIIALTMNQGPTNVPVTYQHQAALSTMVVPRQRIY